MRIFSGIDGKFNVPSYAGKELKDPAPVKKVPRERRRITK
jgi:hypothetical protein